MPDHDKVEVFNEAGRWEETSDLGAGLILGRAFLWSPFFGAVSKGNQKEPTAGPAFRERPCRCRSPSLESSVLSGGIA